MEDDDDDGAAARAGGDPFFQHDEDPFADPFFQVDILLPQMLSLGRCPSLLLICAYRCTSSTLLGISYCAP